MDGSVIDLARSHWQGIFQFGRGSPAMIVLPAPGSSTGQKTQARPAQPGVTGDFQVVGQCLDAHHAYAARPVRAAEDRADGGQIVG